MQMEITIIILTTLFIIAIALNMASKELGIKNCNFINW